MTTLWLLPTTISVRPQGEQLMAWGSAALMEGLTNRLLFSSGDASARLMFDQREMAVRLQCGGASVRLRHHNQIVLGDLPLFRVERYELGHWMLTCDDVWQHDPTHEGVVPCSSCLQPYKRVMQRGTACRNLACGKSCEQATWSAAQSYFVKGEPLPGMRCEQWFKEIGIR